jgi:hypothetical protein
MVAQVFSDAGAWGWLVLLGAALQIVLVIAFFALVANVGVIRQIVSRIAQGASSIRVCGLCRTACDPLASVCPHCTREIGAWTAYENRWWVRRDGGWLYLDTTDNQFKTSEGSSPPPPPRT